MTLEAVLIMCVVTPIIIGVVAACFSNNSTTPIIIDYQTPSQPFIENIQAEEEFLSAPDRLEEAAVTLDFLNRLGKKGEVSGSEVATVEREYQFTRIPVEMDESLNELFEAIDGDLTSNSTQVNGSKSDLNLPEEHSGVEDIQDYTSSLPTIDQMIDQLDSSAVPTGLTAKEYEAIERKYGNEIVSQITTTPAIGRTSDYDTMIGRIVDGYLYYGDDRIPLKGKISPMVEAIGLVEGIFMNTDSFYVYKFISLDAEVLVVAEA